VGIGSIITTVYRNGVAEKIPNLDSTTNAACTNPGDGSGTSGASGFWVKDGETSPNGTPADTAQGNCMTCHDVHWALADTDPEAEPFRRECTTCHSNPGGSASGAPQIDLTKINHLATPGTPLENMATDPDAACETCHMPKSSSVGYSSPMHLWRINTDPTYQTFGATQVNTTAPDGAGWVDLDHACGQCHGGSGAAKPGIPHFTTAQLAAVANGIHDSAGVSYPVTFSATKVGVLGISVSASVNCGGPCPSLDYDWNWGDGLSHGSGAVASHTYAAGGPETITLALSSSGKAVGSVSRKITLDNPDLPPTVASTCTFDSDTWTEQVVDSSSDDGPDADALAGDGTATLNVVVDWGDGSTKSFGGAGGPTRTHTYLNPGTYIVTHKAIDSALQLTSETCGPVSPAYFTISGTVHKSDGTTALPSATVTLRKGAVAKTVYTGALGTFTAGSLKPGTYTLTVSKSGYTFPASAPITVGPSSPGNVIDALTP
jgi:hypothetical protein